MQMLNEQEWIKSAIQSAYDFSSNMTGDYLEYYFDENDLIKNDYECPSVGAFINLNLNNKKIKIGVLAKQEDLEKLSKYILALPSSHPINQDEISDVSKEFLNIIAGGVKSKLSHTVDHEIKLSIPEFHYSVSNHDISDRKVAKFSIFNLPLFLSMKVE